jgi:hypothetical protein
LPPHDSAPTSSKGDASVQFLDYRTEHHHHDTDIVEQYWLEQ